MNLLPPPRFSTSFSPLGWVSRDSLLKGGARWALIFCILWLDKILQASLSASSQYHGVASSPTGECSILSTVLLQLGLAVPSRSLLHRGALISFSLFDAEKKAG